MADFTVPTLYFAYGSNLWLDQMRRRCPGSTYIGTALLPKWKWFINTAGYANVKESGEDIVYGMVYTLTAEDEAKLDGFEGVPYNYIKRTLPVKFFGKRNGEVAEGREIIEALVYVDVECLVEGPPAKEYIFRVNRAVDDAVLEGVPQDYIDKYIRPFIPANRLKN
ncbi:Butirosin biosynthesis, BtrG-like protein [Lyophyllum atratum]|nr:Butirosin biosynthesis, BtrG-like protein [Lyophyllum atratum]